MICNECHIIRYSIMKSIIKYDTSNNMWFVGYPSHQLWADTYGIHIYGISVMIWYQNDVICHWSDTCMIWHTYDITSLYIIYIYVINMMRYQYDKIWVCLWNDIFWYQCRYDDSLIWCEHIVKSGWIDISKIMNSGMNIFLIQNGMMSVTWYHLTC